MKMTRQEAIRLAGVSSAAAFVGGATLGADAAWAMNPRFDAVLGLTSTGMVKAGGPTNFAADEARARIYAYVAQGQWVQTGQTGWVDASRKTWATMVSGPALKPGPADAYGLAYVQLKSGGYEWYPWEVQVTLR